MKNSRITADNIMWIRTQLKIGWADLARAVFASLRSLERNAEQQSVEHCLNPEGNAIATLSLRSGFDLLLQALQLEPGDEVLFTALNVKVMVKIVKQMGLVPVPIDLDLNTMAPRLDLFEKAITPRSKVFVAAHLFGSRINLAAAFEIAKKNNLLAVEDCAQVFNGTTYLGNPKADVTMFSFGPIKTATALGGGVICVKNQTILKRMRDIQATYPVQPDRKQRKRILQFMALKLLTTKSVLGALHKWYSIRGKDYENALADRVRGVAPLKTANKMRQQPSATLLWMMKDRMTHHQTSKVDARAEKGRALTRRIADTVQVPGQGNSYHDYWVYPILVSNPKDTIKALRRAGFDAADLPRSQHIEAPSDRPSLYPTAAVRFMRSVVIVPCYPDMPDSELNRLADNINAHVFTEHAQELVLRD
jgi:perosamine synthetase